MKLKLAIFAVVISALPAAAQIGRRPTCPQVNRPDGPVRQVIRRNCTACHGIDDYAYFALDRVGWRSLIETKHKAGDTALAEPLSENDRNLLLDWVVSKFGPDTKPFTRTYIPPEITTCFSDPEAYRLLVTAVDMRERGAKLTDEDLERLVEWLGRVWGTNQDK
jgi:hypothetical protein